MLDTNTTTRQIPIIENYIWKGNKIRVNKEVIQNTYRLLDCTEDQLRQFYAHCNLMLYNSSKEKPGRYPLLNIIQDQRDRCNTELFTRWLESQGTPKFKFLEALTIFLENNKKVIEDPKTFIVDKAMSGCPAQFAGIQIGLVVEGCSQMLGEFNRKHITLAFILKQGLWFTQEENKELTQAFESGDYASKLDVVKERLKLRNNINFYLTPKGLSYTQLRSMTTLRSKKYQDMTSAQLLLLRDRILFSLEQEVKKHISQWELKQKEILEVAEALSYSI